MTKKESKMTQESEQENKDEFQEPGDDDAVTTTFKNEKDGRYIIMRIDNEGVTFNLYDPEGNEEAEAQHRGLPHYQVTRTFTEMIRHIEEGGTDPSSQGSEE